MAARYSSILLLSGLCLGIAADLLFFRHSLGLGMTIFCALLLATLLGLGRYWQRPPQSKNIWIGVAAFGFATFLSIRNEPALIFFNFIAMAGLLFLQFCFYRGKALVRMPFLQVIYRMFMAIAIVIAAPIQSFFSLLGSFTKRQDLRSNKRLFWPIVRGCLFAIVVLLSAADVVFSQYLDKLFSFQLPFDLSVFVDHGFVIGFFTFVAAGMLFVAFGQHYEQMMADSNDPPSVGITQRLYPRTELRILGATEALIVLGSVALLFASFMLVQATYFFGGMDTLELTGITFSEYARKGFFELLTVAILSLGMLWLAVIITRREQLWQKRAFVIVCSVIIVLVLGMLVSAFQRMWLYEQAYGFTRLRIYTHSFMLWLAFVLVLFFFVLLRNTHRTWLYGTFISALVYLALLNLASPDSLIVRANFARYQAGEELDADYLANLSSDAAPALYALLPQFNTQDQAIITRGMGEQSFMYAQESDWRGWNWSRWRLAHYFEPVLPSDSR
jgi:hypothetical protein